MIHVEKIFVGFNVMSQQVSESSESSAQTTEPDRIRVLILLELSFLEGKLLMDVENRVTS